MWPFASPPKDTRAGQWKVGTAVRARTAGKDVPGAPRDRSRVVVVALILTNALFVFWKKEEAAGEESPLLRYSTSAAQQKQTPAFNGELHKFLNDERERFSVKVHRRHARKGHGLQSFVLLRGYRTGPTTFAALGLAAVAFHSIKEAEVCRWEGRDGTIINGTVSLHYPGEAHRLRYEALILMCDLVAPADGRAGGQLVMRIDKDDAVVYREEPGADPSSPHGPFRHNITHCSPPIRDRLDAERLRQWMEFHRLVHAVDFFVLYDAGGVDAAVRDVVEPFARRGMAEVADVRGAAAYETWAYAQVLLANDCLYRTKHTSSWTLFSDFDEYLSFPSPEGPQKLPQYLAAREHVPWVSFGSLFYSIAHCSQALAASEGSWAVERLPFHEREAHCQTPGKFRSRGVCLEWAGHRKYVLQPRAVHVAQIHRVMNPRGGLNAPTTEARLNHFRGLANGNQSICRFVWEDGAFPPRLVLDPSVAQLAASARKRHSLAWFAD